MLANLKQSRGPQGSQGLHRDVNINQQTLPDLYFLWVGTEAAQMISGRRGPGGGWLEGVFEEGTTELGVFK